jgi:hypothetical protein
MTNTCKKTSRQTAEIAALSARELTGVRGGGAVLTTTSASIFEQKVRVEQKVRESSFELNFLNF